MSDSARYRFAERWHITGVFTTDTPMHIGSGGVTKRDELLNEKSKKPCEIQAVVPDWRGRPCIPGSAIKGVLRSWAEGFLTDQSTLIKKIFGDPDVRSESAESGRAEFLTAYIDGDFSLLSPEHIPHWCEKRLTGVMSHVSIDRKTGAADPEKLFFEEFVPRGVPFKVEILATRLAEDDIRFLLAVLEHGWRHPTHPYQLGANGSDGWGRIRWSLDKVACLRKTAISLEALSHRILPAAMPEVRPMGAEELTCRVIPHVAVELTLAFQGPFLVNDGSKTKEKDAPEDDERPNFAPLRHPDGTVWLPSSSFRGALRQRAEFLLGSLNASAMVGTAGPSAENPGNGSIERLFGETERSSKLTILEFTEVGTSSSREQQLVAIDRFTGGAADGALFKAIHADVPTLRSRLVLDLEGLEPWDVALLALVLRDVCLGRVTFGYGAGKGYGEAFGAIKLTSSAGVPAGWRVPASAAEGRLDAGVVAWLNDAMRGLPRPVVPAASAPAAVGARPAAPAAAATQSAPPVLKQGTLGWQGAGNNRRRVLSVPNQKLPFQVRPDALAASLRGNQGDSIAVDFELERGQPVRIRPAGELWTAGGNAGGATEAKGGRFIHPYYFLTLADRTPFRGELADSRPIGHERLEPGRYSGTIGVRLTTKTPLLICDDEHSTEQDGHQTYAMRTQDDKPLVMSSSVRGMLRSAYEAITNSRFGVFPGKPITDGKPAEKHGRRWGFRLPANAGLDTVPVRIVLHNGALAAEVLPGASRMRDDGRVVTGDPVFAAWCGSYRGGPAAWRPAGRLAFGHRAKVWAYLTPWHYHRSLPRGAIDFDFWNVEAISAGGGTVPTGAPSASSLRAAFGRSTPAGWGTPGWHQGYLCVTGLNMSNKHDERFFFSSAPSATVRIPLELDTIEQWRQLIQDYQGQHEREIDEGEKGPPTLPGCVFSRHITGSAARSAKAEQDLREDDLCHAQIAKVDGTWRVLGLYPVMISRKLYDKSPLDLLHPSLRPAKTIGELSPADRVFGWVSQDPPPDDPEPAYRGHVRVGAVTCSTPDAIEPLPEAKRTLAILAQPKPQQGRFYLGQANGSAQPKGRSKEAAGYGGTNRIRGPKVYPHHGEFTEATWRGREASNQNRSITNWVKPETSFELKLHVENLSRFELGALIWLLSLPADHYLRMGLGKPLGFGSVRAEILPDATRVAAGSAWAASLSDWDGPPPVTIDLNVPKKEFETAIKAVNPTLLSAFLRAAAGFLGSPVHYPRIDAQRADEGEHYRWFVANEKGEQISLPDLTGNDPSLPLLSGK